MALHRTNQNDWDKIPKSSQSFLQRIAARSNGILTLPNLITLVGGGFVVYGLMQLSGQVSQDDVIKATIYIVFGRILDVADGYAAEWTKTKSPFGEALDASVDKIALFLVVLVLLYKDIVPSWVLLIMLLHGLFNTVLSILAVKNGQRFHPSAFGKVAVWFEWLSIASFMTASFVAVDTFWHGLALVLAWIGLGVFVTLGAYASFCYAKNFKKYTALKD